MSSGGETEKDPSGLTVDTLRILLTQEVAAIRGTIAEMDRRYQERFEAQQAATEEKDRTIQARLANINEFRAQQSDIVANTMPRAEIEQRFNALDSKIEALGRQMAADNRLVNSRLDLQAGNTAGVDKTRQIIAWGIAALLGLISIGTILFAATGR